jgi:hypothetical protein
MQRKIHEKNLANRTFGNEAKLKYLDTTVAIKIRLMWKLKADKTWVIPRFVQLRP